MVRKSLILMTLLAVASPLAAQEEYVWTSKRPDGHAPIGVTGARNLEPAAIEVAYRLSQLSSRGVWLANDSVPLASTLELYQTSPLSLSQQTHNVSISYGVTDRLTVIADVDYATRKREQRTDSAVSYATFSNGLGDVSLAGLYNIVDQGPYKAHIQLGALIPTGAESVFRVTPFSAPNTEALPYDMRRGAGTFAVLPGLTVQAQNEVATVGVQAKARIYIGSNDARFNLGQSYTASVWAAHTINEYFSLSGRIHWQHWGNIDGSDPDLDKTRDPGNDAFFLGGERVDVPIGVNFYFPEGVRFAGHRLSFEAIFPVSHEYQGLQLGLDWGLVVGWQMVF